MVNDACLLSAKLVNHLLRIWVSDVHVYNVNIPLFHGVRSTKIYFTRLLENRSGSLFQLLSVQENEEHARQGRINDPAKMEQKLREEGTTEEDDNTPQDDSTDWHNETDILSLEEFQGIKRWQWSLDFKGLEEYVAEHGHKGGGMTDGWCINQRWASVTALRAAYQVVDGGGGNAHGGQEIILDS